MVIASKNQGKVEEIRHVLDELELVHLFVATPALHEVEGALRPRVRVANNAKRKVRRPHLGAGDGTNLARSGVLGQAKALLEFVLQRLAQGRATDLEVAKTAVLAEEFSDRGACRLGNVNEDEFVGMVDDHGSGLQCAVTDNNEGVAARNVRKKHR